VVSVPIGWFRPLWHGELPITRISAAGVRFIPCHGPAPAHFEGGRSSSRTARISSTPHRLLANLQWKIVPTRGRRGKHARAWGMTRPLSERTWETRKSISCYPRGTKSSPLSLVRQVYRLLPRHGDIGQVDSDKEPGRPSDLIGSPMSDPWQVPGRKNDHPLALKLGKYRPGWPGDRVAHASPRSGQDVDLEAEGSSHQPVSSVAAGPVRPGVTRSQVAVTRI
jgi:hypothetical protein